MRREVPADLEIRRDGDVDLLAVRRDSVQQRRVMQRTVPCCLEPKIHSTRNQQTQLFVLGFDV